MTQARLPSSLTLPMGARVSRHEATGRPTGWLLSGSSKLRGRGCPARVRAAGGHRLRCCPTRQQPPWAAQRRASLPQPARAAATAAATAASPLHRTGTARWGWAPPGSAPACGSAGRSATRRGTAPRPLRPRAPAPAPTARAAGAVGARWAGGTANTHTAAAPLSSSCSSRHSSAAVKHLHHTAAAPLSSSGSRGDERWASGSRERERRVAAGGGWRNPSGAQRLQQRPTHQSSHAKGCGGCGSGAQEREPGAEGPQRRPKHPGCRASTAGSWGHPGPIGDGQTGRGRARAGRWARPPHRPARTPRPALARDPLQPIHPLSCTPVRLAACRPSPGDPRARPDPPRASRRLQRPP